MQQEINIIKYGTAVLTTQDLNGREMMDFNTMSQHGNILNNFTENVIIVSSGAVGLGRSIMKEKKIKAEKILEKRLLAEMGQPLLVEAWRKSMPDKIILQKLVTYSDLERKTSLDTIKSALENNFLYIFNFNDGVDDSELQETKNHEFGDNDHLASQVTKICTPLAKFNRVIFNTSSDGFLNKDSGETVKTLFIEDLTPEFIKYHCHGTSRGGTGGMAEKLLNLKSTIENGADEAWIINGKKPEQLKIILEGGHAGTKIIKK